MACAEGHFTVQLAPRVRNLIAADSSEVALDRARERCGDADNVTFVRLDLVTDPLPGRFDLIVCSEVLYYVGGRPELLAVGGKLARALEPGGHLVAAHAHVLADDPEAPGFAWGVPFGARVIGETLASVPELELLREIRTPFYRVQRFRRKPRIALSAKKPVVLELPQPAPLPPEVEASARRGGGEPTPPLEAATDRLPILMYHRVAPAGSPATARYRVTPQAFEKQLRYLREAGYRSAGLEEWRLAVHQRRPLPGRAVLITFDDGYGDFLEHAWPLLRRLGFTATVFLVAGEVGGWNGWDAAYGERIRLLGWDEVRRLRDEGIEFGSHSASHPALTGLSPEEVVREAARSRAILTRELGAPPEAFAYPYGDADAAVRHLVGACGYTYGLTTRWGRAALTEDLLALRRLEVSGLDRFRDFVAKLAES